MAQPVNTDDNTIKVVVSDETPEVEYYATELITPGMLCEVTPGVGSYVPTHCRRHSTNLGTASALFAIEDPLWGKTMDHSYLTDNRVHLVEARTGDVILVWVVEGGSTEPELLQSMFLVPYWNASDQGGHLQPIGIQSAILQTESVVCQALESLNPLTSTPTRILARVV